MIKICLGIASVLILFTFFLNKKSYDFEKLSQYECGIEPFDENQFHLEKFYLKFYIIGIIFLIFDLESILLYPIIFYSPSQQLLSPAQIGAGGGGYTGYIIFLIFMFMLILGLIYEYKKKVLN